MRDIYDDEIELYGHLSQWLPKSMDAQLRAEFPSTPPWLCWICFDVADGDEVGICQACAEEFPVKKE